MCSGGIAACRAHTLRSLGLIPYALSLPLSFLFCSLSLSFLIGLHNISSMLFAIVPVGAGGHLMANSTFAGYNLVRVPLEPVSGTRWSPCSNCALA